MEGIPGYAYLIEDTETGSWQKIGVAADRRRLSQHRGWRPLKATVQVPGYRLADPRADVEAPVLAAVRRAKWSSSGDPRCPDCAAEMPELPASGHTEAWHVPCRGSQEQLFGERLDHARETNPYPDWSRPYFTDGKLLAHSMKSRDRRLVHVAEFPHMPNRSAGSDAAEHTLHVATSFYVRNVPAELVLDALSAAAMSETRLGKFIMETFGENARKKDGSQMLKTPGSGGINTIAKAQERLDDMARVPSISVAFINDRTAGIVHAFAAPECQIGPWDAEPDA